MEMITLMNLHVSLRATHLTVEERKQKRRTMVITVGISILIMAAIILAITLIVSVQTAIDNRNNEAENGEGFRGTSTGSRWSGRAVGGLSQNIIILADMVNRAKESFPGETGLL